MCEDPVSLPTGECALHTGAWLWALRSGLQAAPPATLARGPPQIPGTEVGGRLAAHRLVCADGVHLGPKHHRREDEEEQPLEAQQDEEDDRGGRREGAALWKGRHRGSGQWPAAPAPGLPRCLQAQWRPPATDLAAQPRRERPWQALRTALSAPSQPVMSVSQGRAQRLAHGKSREGPRAEARRPDDTTGGHRCRGLRPGLALRLLGIAAPATLTGV